MPSNPNRLAQIWQELKRRNVIRVITVYAGASFVILELIDIIAEPLKLPPWLLPVAIVLLSIGFIIAVILSWIYDIHPDIGMVKTEPVDSIKIEDAPKSSSSWKIASIISFAVIVGLIVLNVVPRSSNKKILDKSIAVLPFINDSPVSENAHIIKGYMTAVHNNLCQIKDLRVLTLQSTEQYRNDTKSTPDIARELGVGYLLTASGQILNNRIRLTVRLADAEDEIIWSNPYDRQIKSVEDHFELQSNIAQLVAGKLQSAITPEEKQRIEKISTSNATAYEFYQKGMDDLNKGDVYNPDPDALNDAEKLFWHALEYDSTMAEAYAGLANVNFARNYFRTDGSSEDYLDTALILADKAISLDPQLSDAYTIKGFCYAQRYQQEKAIQAFDKALELNPNDWFAYQGKAYSFHTDDLVKIIDNLQQAISRCYGPSLYTMISLLGNTFYAAGYKELGDSCLLEVYTLNEDSVLYLSSLCQREVWYGTHKKGLKYAEHAYELDSLDETSLMNLGSIYSYTGQFEKSIHYWEKYMDLLESTGRNIFLQMHRIGYAYWENGNHEKGDYYMEQQVDVCENSIKLGNFYAGSRFAYYTLAGINAFRGETDRALVYLRIFNERERIPLYSISLIKSDPLFDSIRDQPEFQQIVHDLESKYQAEHERVGHWLEEKDML